MVEAGGGWVVARGRSRVATGRQRVAVEVVVMTEDFDDGGNPLFA